MWGGLNFPTCPYPRDQPWRTAPAPSTADRTWKCSGEEVARHPGTPGAALCPQPRGTTYLWQGEEGPVSCRSSSISVEEGPSPCPAPPKSQTGILCLREVSLPNKYRSCGAQHTLRNIRADGLCVKVSPL